MRRHALLPAIVRSEVTKPVPTGIRAADQIWSPKIRVNNKHTRAEAAAIIPVGMSQRTGLDTKAAP